MAAELAKSRHDICFNRKTGCILTERMVGSVKTDIELEIAIGILLEQVQPLTGIESVPLSEALGRVAAAEVQADFDQPPFNRSPLDGYAFHGADSVTATAEQPITLVVVGAVYAGRPFYQAVERGQAVKVMTGGQVPEGCDCVIRQEDVQVCGAVIQIPYALQAYENYCFAGEDVAGGAVIIERGKKISAAHIGVLAAMGRSTVTVFRRPRVALGAAGDELVEPGRMLGPGQIYNSNAAVLTTRLTALGAVPVQTGIFADDVAVAAGCIRKFSPDVDLWLTTGGVSVGEKDIFHEVVLALPAQPLFWRVCMKPGAPVLAYRAGRRLCISLSGNPFAALVTFELLVRPVLARLSRQPDMICHRKTAIFRGRFPKVSHGRRFIRCCYEDGEATIPEQHASGTLFSMVACNAFIDIPAGTPFLSDGQPVQVLLV